MVMAPDGEGMRNRGADVRKRNNRRLYSFLSAIFLIACLYTLLFQSFSAIPAHYRINVGDRITLGDLLPPGLSAQITASVPEDVQGKLSWQSGQEAGPRFCPFLGNTPIAAVPGRLDLDLRLFGILPLKRITLQVVPPVKVMVGGQSIGVMLHTDGVIVSGFAAVTSEDGKTSCPARQAGIAPGDVIASIEGVQVQSDTQVSQLIDSYARRGGPVHLLIKRQGTAREFDVNPVLCRDTKRYRVGLFVRDSAAGVGTLTFFDPATRRYGALGHLITNSDTGAQLDLRDGKIVGAVVEGIEKGERGKIGEKIGMFINTPKTSGSIEKNTKYGIYGVLQDSLPNRLYPEPVPVAVGGQIKTGPAQLLTVLNGETIEAFDVEIQTVFPQPTPDGKSFIVKVVDPRILDRAGGIIQGMSGSPIIQDGRLIGAVTHVFINDPTRGYGISAELMLEEAGLFMTGGPVQEHLSVLDYRMLDGITMDDVRIAERKEKNAKNFLMAA
jgi:stage IV sporulation protein B